MNTPFDLYENTSYDEEQYYESEPDYSYYQMMGLLNDEDESSEALDAEKNVSTHLTGSSGLDVLDLDLEKRDNFLDLYDDSDSDEDETPDVPPDTGSSNSHVAVAKSRDAETVAEKELSIPNCELLDVFETDSVVAQTILATT